MNDSQATVLAKKTLASVALLCAYSCVTTAAKAAPHQDIQLAAFSSPGKVRVLVNALSFAGDPFVEWSHSATGWQYKQYGVCAGYGAAPAIGSPIVAFFNPADGKNHGLVVHTDGHIYDWKWSDGASCMQPTDVTAQAQLPSVMLGPTSFCAPTNSAPCFDSMSGLTGFIDSSNRMHVFFVASDSSIVEGYFPPGGQWSRGNPGGHGVALSSGMGGGITSLWGGSIEQIYYTGTDGNLWQDYFVDHWVTIPFTGPNGYITPHITASQSPSGYITASMMQGTEVIWGVETDSLLSGNLRIVEWTGSQWQSAAWNDSNLAISGAPMTSMNGAPYIAANASSLGIHIYDGTPTDLQQTYGGADVGSSRDNEFPAPIVSLQENGYQHLFYVGADQGLHEYYQNGGPWQPNLDSSKYPYVDYAIY